MIEIHLFEQLVAFADSGTLSAAAEQLHISQPALSRSMQRLEEELGVKLFDRQKSRLSLNENGELAVRYARNLLLQESSMIDQIREFDRKKRTISVGSCTPILIPDFVSLLSSLYEGMTISTEVTGDLEWQSRRGVKNNRSAFSPKRRKGRGSYFSQLKVNNSFAFSHRAIPLLTPVVFS